MTKPLACVLLASGGARACILWVDRHVHKNAGTSIRSLMSRTFVGAGTLHKLAPYHEVPLNHGWSQVFGTFASIAPPCDPSVSLTRVAVEVHEGIHEFGSRWMAALRALRSGQRSRCCRVLHEAMRSGTGRGSTRRRTRSAGQA